MKTRKEIRIGLAESLSLTLLKNQVMRFAYGYVDPYPWTNSDKNPLKGKCGCALCSKHEQGSILDGCENCIYYSNSRDSVYQCVDYRYAFKSDKEYCEARELDYLIAYTMKSYKVSIKMK